MIRHEKENVDDKGLREIKLRESKSTREPERRCILLTFFRESKFWEKALIASHELHVLLSDQQKSTRERERKMRDRKT